MFDLSTAPEALSHLDPALIKMAWDIVGREGGYVNDPNDSGGPTNHGVSLQHARAQGLAFDIDHNGVVDDADIRMITPEMAVVDFLMCFLIQPGINKLPVSIQPCSFDHSVNGGPSASIRLVQTAANSLRVLNVPLKVDGVLGPNTLVATMKVNDARGGDAFLNALVDARDAEYRAIVARKPETQKFLKGWLARSESFRPHTSA